MGSSAGKSCLGFNRLNGTLSEGMGRLSMLEGLSLEGNSLEGMISEAHMSNLSKLTILGFSCNSLALNLSPDWFLPFHLSFVSLSNCNLRPRFPKWLQSQKKLVFVGYL